MARRKGLYPKSARLPVELSEELTGLVKVIVERTDTELPELIRVIVQHDDTNGVNDKVMFILLDRLLCELRSDNDEVRQRVSQALKEIGPPAVNMLVAHLFESKDTAYRLRLIDILAAIGPRANLKVVMSLIAMLINQQNPVICAATWQALFDVRQARVSAESVADDKEAAPEGLDTTKVQPNPSHLPSPDTELG